ncbi:MAG: PfkB family carbohydrate kinase [Anaerolineaceae bacterium]|nr:PfkB family carbohydrate kinase [Anaerolineaceae bacterium]
MNNAFYFSIGTLIIDDIVQPDGKTHMKTLGGGATHAVMGMRVWAEHVGLLTRLAKDFNPQDFPALQANFDLSGLERLELAHTPRAWQLFDQDGKRTEVFKTNFQELRQLLPQPSPLKGIYAQAAGVHLHAAPEMVEAWLPFLREVKGLSVLWEPWDPFCVPKNRTEFYRLGRMMDIVSPNLEEARALSGLSDPNAIALEWQKQGIPMSLIRLGKNGCLVCGKTKNPQHILSYPVRKVVDVTGAGNACCGGFIVGLHQTGDPSQAAKYGNISASFALRQYGALYPLAGVHQKALWRLKRYKTEI